MRAAGVEIVADYSEVSVVGITELLAISPLSSARCENSSRLASRKVRLRHPHRFPGFHLRLARKLKWRGMRNAYYICPQFWAWRPWRVRIVRRRFALGLCIFPFEEEFYADAGVPTKFIGWNSLVGHVKPTLDRAAFRAAHHLYPEEPLIAVLPGSCSAELRQHLLRCAMHACESIKPSPARISSSPPPPAAATPLSPLSTKTGPRSFPLRVVANQTYDALSASDAAIVSSGTATVETALLDVPMVVFYRVSPLTALLAEAYSSAPNFSAWSISSPKSASSPNSSSPTSPPTASPTKSSPCSAQRRSATPHAHRPRRSPSPPGSPRLRRPRRRRHPRSHPSSKASDQPPDRVGLWVPHPFCF